jgi:hypothetical protein
VVSAANDAQVPASDADRIFATLASDERNKTRLTIADANHVYKAETRAPSTISQAVSPTGGYAPPPPPMTLVPSERTGEMRPKTLPSGSSR